MNPKIAEDNSLRYTPHDMEDAVRVTRGQIIHICTELETIIDIYIAKHFLPRQEDDNKVQELVCLILAPRVTWENKRQVFTCLVDVYNPDFRKKNSQYPTDFDLMIQTRNNFAHYPFDNSKDANEKYIKDGTISFMKFKNVRDNKTKKIELFNKVSYSVTEIHSIINCIYDYSDRIKLLCK